jgi:flagellin-like hook-associated protein FlgL
MPLSGIRQFPCLAIELRGLAFARAPIPPMRIHTTLRASELRIINQIDRLGKAIEQNNLRLSTLKRINSAADDPAGLVFVSARRAELTDVQALLGNVERAGSIVDFADSVLAEVSTHLNTIRTAALDAAGGTLTQAELQANQDQVDAAVEAINLLSRSVFGGRRLLDGSHDYLVSGVNTAEVRAVRVYDRNTATASQTLSINVTVAAEQAQLNYAGKPGGLVQADAEFTITGTAGSVAFDVAEDESLTDVRDRINDESYATGVTASVSGDNLVLESADYGSDATIAVEVTSGAFAVTGGNGDGTAAGVDAVANVNGTSVTGDGLALRYRSSSLDADIQLDPGAGTGALDSITVTGEGLSFQFSPLATKPVSLGLPGIHSANLGGLSGALAQVASGGGTSLMDGDFATLIRIVDEAQSQVLVTQARLGAFSNYTLDSAENTLDAAAVNLSDAIELVEDADIATETALLARHQLLADNAATALIISGNQSQAFLQMLQRIAFS